MMDDEITSVLELDTNLQAPKPEVNIPIKTESSK